MFAPFILALREAGLPVGLTEWLALVAAMRARVAEYSVEDFYFLARAALVKDERHLDRFDRVFAQVFKGLGPPEGEDHPALPEEWLRRILERQLSAEERAAIAALGGIERLMEALRQRLAEQRGRHEGGQRWIGTAGTSPFGAYGDHPEAVRIGQEDSRRRGGAKLWERREFRDLADDAALGARGMKLALRRLRRFAREGEASELDLPGTIRDTARQAGWLELRMVPERRNAVKVLLLLDVGGSMEEHVVLAEQLFTAARAEFKHLRHYYFHNCVYERVWTSNTRRHAHLVPTVELLRRFGPDWKLILVGDAAMSPHEILSPGGSVEHWNEEAGQVWIRRLKRHFRRVAWLNPVPETQWRYTPSIGLMAELMEGAMYPLTLEGIDRMARALLR
ncbi:MAG: VWA domain-containing protein [Rhodovarius sp.]|nr:VWA domain-containing protein [Rhodovarius sp.]